MSVIKHFNKDLYPSIQKAISEILKEHIVSNFNEADNYATVYSGKALDDILGFLAFNDIQHQYIRLPASTSVNCDEIILIAWEYHGEVGHEAWYSKGYLKNTFHVDITIIAEAEEEIEEWISNIDNMDILDWSVERI